MNDTASSSFFCIAYTCRIVANSAVGNSRTTFKKSVDSSAISGRIITDLAVVNRQRTLIENAPAICVKLIGISVCGIARNGNIG